MRIISGRLVAAVLFSVFVLASCARPTEPEFENGWVRAMPPGSKMTAGFGTLHNGTVAPIAFETFSSPYFRNVSLHRTEEVDGVSKMREVDRLVLQSDETVEMAPGGYHLMLMLPLKSIVPGQTVPLEFMATDGRVFRFEAPVERR